jgi:glutathione S-transferase
MWKLITIPFSHYREKARWALDYSQRPYKELAYLPGLHLTATALRNCGKTVPVLRTGVKDYTDSTDILQFADRERIPHVPSLFGTNAALREDILRFEDQLDERLGPAARLLVYHHLLESVDTLVQIVGHGYGPLGKKSLGPVMRGLRGGIRKGYRITPERAAQAEDKIRRVFAETDQRLAGGTPFLFGMDFTAADLTLAALAGPVLMWPESIYHHDGRIATQDPIEALPPGLKNFVQSLRATTTGKHCLQLYRHHRRVRH